MIERHDDDHQASQHIDGIEAVTASVGGIHRADIETFTVFEQSSRMRITIYGIRNCDTMKKARVWLEAQGIDHEFHDYKVAGIDRPTLEKWVKAVGWEVLLNRAGTTFRKLPDDAKANIDEGKAIRLMLEQPSMIKRPVLERGRALLVGFSPEKYSALK
jgi:arsenate reductase (glutaredoxin)